MNVMQAFKKKVTKKERRRGNTKTEHSRKTKKDRTGKTIDEDLTATVMAPAPITAPPSQNAPPVVPGQTGHPIVEQWVQRALDFGVEKLSDEFRQMAKYKRQDMTQNAFNANQSANINESKNRYADVPCQDQFIVPLTKPPAVNDYIHANFVGTPMVSDKRFICTQGPLDHTIDDFWWMIVQQKVEQIVMLCKVIETGKYKCAQYWPLNMGEKREVTGGIVVENVSGTRAMERDAEIKVTTLNVYYSGQTQVVRHLHWTEWPDRGVPPCKLTIMELLSAVRGSRMPIVVHCSAGIGRTGTIVAIEYILERIAENKQCPPMPDLVKGLRDQRAYSIQTDLQYLYIHRVMLNYFLEKYKDKYASLLTPDNIAKYDKFIKDYDAVAKQ